MGSTIINPFGAPTDNKTITLDASNNHKVHDAVMGNIGDSLCMSIAAVALTNNNDITDAVVDAFLVSAGASVASGTIDTSGTTAVFKTNSKKYSNVGNQNTRTVSAARPNLVNATPKVGIKITVGATDTMLNSIKFDGNATTGYLCDSNRSTLASISIGAGGLADFQRLLLAGRTYYILSDSGGAAFNSWNQSLGVSYPINLTEASCVASFDGTADDTTKIWNVIEIYFANVDATKNLIQTKSIPQLTGRVYSYFAWQPYADEGTALGATGQFSADGATYQTAAAPNVWQAITGAPTITNGKFKINYASGFGTLGGYVLMFR